MSSSREVVRGRPFANGNSGRRKASKNRSTVLASALLDGEQEALLRKAIEEAKAGNIPMLKFLLSRVLPRDRQLKIELPRMAFADDAVEALGTVTQQLAEGTISATEAAALATLINAYSRTIEVADVVARLNVLEAKLGGELDHNWGKK